jgi:hypothetical protein
VKRSGRPYRVKVSADGKGVVSHAGTALLRELAAETGLAGAVTGALLDTYRGIPVHMPGQVFSDLAVAIAGGADAVTGIEVLRDREALFGPVASMPTAWRLLDRIDEQHLPGSRASAAAARERAWRARAAPEAGGGLRIDFDATISIAHSEKENTAATWKKTEIGSGPQIESTIEICGHTLNSHAITAGGRCGYCAAAWKTATR